jgi:hypothetical protein
MGPRAGVDAVVSETAELASAIRYILMGGKTVGNERHFFPPTQRPLAPLVEIVWRGSKATGSEGEQGRYCDRSAFGR